MSSQKRTTKVPRTGCRIFQSGRYRGTGKDGQMNKPEHPELTTLAKALKKLEDYTHLHENDLGDEAIHSLTGAIVELEEAIKFIKAGL